MGEQGEQSEDGAFFGFLEGFGINLMGFYQCVH